MKPLAEGPDLAWWDYDRLPDWVFGVAIVALMTAVTFSYVHYGAAQPYIAEFFILPVLIAAFRYMVVGGVACGVLSALLAGPFAFELMQPGWTAPSAMEYLDWLMLMVYTSIVGAAVGTAILLLHRNKTETIRLQSHDRITGLPNLEGLRLYLTQRLADQDYPAQVFSKYAIRINNYQALVNAFGYQFADEFIRRIAVNIRDRFPPPTLLARVSPATLAVVNEGNPETHLSTCKELLDLQQTHPIAVDGIPVYPELSIGVAWSELDQPDVDHLFANAELAATEARMQPERMILYSPASRTGQLERIRLLGSFSRALHTQQIYLEYQPKLDLRTQRITSAEALARWMHPTHGAIPPAKFIPLLEETRIINSLSTWIMEEVIRQISAWRDQGVDINVSINISARNFDVEETFAGLESLLERHGVDGASLEMEITETSFLHLTERMLDSIAHIRDLGVRIAIDDFGTGYASLSYLRQLPIDVLKLDSSFVNEGLEQPHNLQMVKRMVEIAKDRDLVVVAEGVEQASTLDAVREIGVDQVQGYYISRALPPDALLALVRDRAAPKDQNAQP